MDQPAADASVPPAAAPPTSPRGWIRSEDWLAVLLAGLVLVVALTATYLSPSSNQASSLEVIDESRHELQLIDADRLSETSPVDANAVKRVAALEKQIETTTSGLYRNPLKPAVAKVGSWMSNPLDAFTVKGKPVVVGLLGTFAVALVLFGLGMALQGGRLAAFVPAFAVVFLLATVSYLLAGQTVVKNYNLEYALWAILLGMVISNTIGTPAFLRPAMRTELYIKTGLVLLGAEILLSRLLVLGLPGVFVAWVVTPIVLISTYLFGQYVLKIPSKSLNMVISADMSVCGVSAAIATAAACRAKKEELSLAIGISLSFTVIMMIVMPMFIRAVGMNEVVAGAWMGGTIDSTGAVAAAGGMFERTLADGTKLPNPTLEAAATVKMIQNILIGVVAFCVAVYWVAYVEKRDDGPEPSGKARLGLGEIWLRFPKFVIGFVGASILFSTIYSSGPLGVALTEAAIGGTSETLRGWFFCLAFVSIGLETNFRELAHFMRGGKPLVLYVCGQTLNLVLTFAMAWLMFEKLFPQAGAAIGK